MIGTVPASRPGRNRPHVRHAVDDMTGDAFDGDEMLALAALAERFDALAETAELMDDAAGADRFRVAAATARMRAMQKLDD